MNGNEGKQDSYSIKSERLAFLDSLRAVAIIMVVGVHTLSYCMELPHDLKQIVFFIVHTISVPVFFLVDGYLFARSVIHLKTYNYAKYVQSSLFRLLAPWAVFTLAYTLARYAFELTGFLKEKLIVGHSLHEVILSAYGSVYAPQLYFLCSLFLIRSCAPLFKKVLSIENYFVLLFLSINHSICFCLLKDWRGARASTACAVGTSILSCRYCHLHDIENCGSPETVFAFPAVVYSCFFSGKELPNWGASLSCSIFVFDNHVSVFYTLPKWISFSQYDRKELNGNISDSCSHSLESCFSYCEQVRVWSDVVVCISSRWHIRFKYFDCDDYYFHSKRLLVVWNTISKKRSFACFEVSILRFSVKETVASSNRSAIHKIPNRSNHCIPRSYHVQQPLPELITRTSVSSIRSSPAIALNPARAYLRSLLSLHHSGSYPWWTVKYSKEGASHFKMQRTYSIYALSRA